MAGAERAEASYPRDGPDFHAVAGAEKDGAGAAEGEGHPPAGPGAQLLLSRAEADRSRYASEPAMNTATAATAGGAGGDADQRRPEDSRAVKEEPSGGGSGGGPGQTAEESGGGVQVQKQNEYSALCRWSLTGFSKIKARALWSRYFEVGGYDCRLLVYPKGDSQALPGYISVYLQMTDPRGSSAKWDCFASYRLCVANIRDEAKSIRRDSWHRFSSKKKSHGWCDFTPSSSVLDPRAGFFQNDTLVITAEILVLHETVSFTRDPEGAVGGGSSQGSGEVLSGKFSWKVHNFPLFKEMIKTQKIMSPVFPAGECNLRLSVYQSNVGGTEYLSMCMESKDVDKSGPMERSCWCLFRTSVISQVPGSQHIHRDSYGRFASDNKSGDNTSLGWNDFMRMSEFLEPSGGYLQDETAVFSAGFHIIKEAASFSRIQPANVPRKVKGSTTGECFQGRFVWRIGHFTRLKELLKKRKITGLCIKSRRFQVGGRDCRLIVYPRGQSQPPMHLSMFLEVTDPSSAGDWSCFVSHRLSVVNQRTESDKSMTKESQNRYSKSAKDWGWREFITLTALFDQDSGFLVSDSVVFSAEVLILKESSEVRDLPCPKPAKPALAGTGSTKGEVPPPALAMAPPGGAPPPPGHVPGSSNCTPVAFTWKVENFLSFKEIMETRKIFSRYFSAGGCELRMGVYESFETLCIYLESDNQAASASSSGAGGGGATGSSRGTDTDPEKNFWVRYRIAVLNQKHPERTEWKESSICTKTWSNSVLQFMKVNELVEGDAGYLVREAVVLCCEVMDCCPWFEFADLEAYASDEEAEVVSTDPDDLLDSEDSDSSSCGPDEDDFFLLTLSRCRAYVSYMDSAPTVSDPLEFQALLAQKLHGTPDIVADFLISMRTHLEDPTKLYSLLAPTTGSSRKYSSLPAAFNMMPHLAPTSPSILSLLMGITALQLPIVDTLLDVTVAACLSRCLAAQADEAAASESKGQDRAEQAEVYSSKGSYDGETSESSDEDLDAEQQTEVGRQCQEGEAGPRQPSGGDGSKDAAATEKGSLVSSAASAAKRSEVHSSSNSGNGASSAFGFPSYGSLWPGQRGGDRSDREVPLAFTDPFSTWMLTSEGPNSAPSQLAAAAAASAAAGDAEEAIASDLNRPTTASRPAAPDEEADATTAADELLSMVVNALRGVVCALDPSLSLGALSETSSDRQRPRGQKGAKGGKGGKVGKDGRRSKGGTSSSSSSSQADASDLAADSVLASTLSTRSPTVQRIGTLLHTAPVYLQPDIILLVPRLVESSEHTAAAGMLLRRLAEASQEGVEVEAELRMPVLAALGLLRIDPAVAEKVLRAALDALPNLSESELPPAVGLVLKLASESADARTPAVQMVRERIAAGGSDVSPGTLDAVRLAVYQHREIAQAILADIEDELKTIKAPPPQRNLSSSQDGVSSSSALSAGKGLQAAGPGGTSTSTAAMSAAVGPGSGARQAAAPGGPTPEGGQRPPGPSLGLFKNVPGLGMVSSFLGGRGPAEGSPPVQPVHVCDVEVLLDMCRMPDFREDAERVFERSVAKGVITETEVLVVLEKRRMQQLMASALPPQLFGAPASSASSATQVSAAPGWPSWPSWPFNLAEGYGFEGAVAEASGAQPSPSTTTSTSASAANKSGPAPGSAGAFAKLGSSASTASSPNWPQLGSLGLGAGAFGAQWGDLSFGLQPLLSGAEEVEPVLDLAESLLSSRATRVRSLVSSMYRVLFRMYSDETIRARILRGLIGRVAAPEASAEKGKAGLASKQGANKAVEKQTTKIAKEVLLSLVEENQGYARAAVEHVLHAAAMAIESRLKVEASQEALSANLDAQRAEINALKASANKAQEQGLARVKGMAEALERTKAEKQAERDRAAEEKRELEARLREAERQTEWARGERDEEMAKAEQGQRDMQQRLKDIEQQTARLKSAKKDDLKKVTKERSALAERVKALEASQRCYEDEVRRLTDEKAKAGKDAERAITAEDARAEAEKRVSSQGGQLAAAKQYIRQLEEKIGQLRSYASGLESNLKEEMTRHAPLYGANLESLHDSELQTLLHIHDDGIKRIQGILAHRQHDDPGARHTVASSLAAVGPSLSLGLAGGGLRGLRGQGVHPATASSLDTMDDDQDPPPGVTVAMGELLGSAFSSAPGPVPEVVPQSGSSMLQAPGRDYQSAFGGLGGGFGTTKSNTGAGSNMW